MLKSHNVVHGSQSFKSSVLISRSLLPIWNQRFVLQPCLMLKRLNAIHDDQSVWWSVLVWRALLRIWNQRFLHQQFSYCEASQCCPWQPKPRIIGTALKRSASILKPTVSAATISYREASRRCPWQQKPKMNRTDVNRSAANLKPTASAAIFFLLWNVSMLPMTTKA